MRPLLRWAGSKRRLVDKMRPYWQPPKHKRYVEPFAGSACLFFALEPSTAIVGDLNRELITTYRAVRDHYEVIAEMLQQLPNSKEQYYRLRSQQLSEMSCAQRATRFIYLNRFCFNGIYRTNGNGTFNVPYGGTRSGALPTRRELEQAARLLERAVLLDGDFEVILRRVRPGDFVYMDPPFRVAKRRVFREYDAERFTESSLSRFSAALSELDRRGVDFLVSYADSPEGRRLAAGFEHRRVRVQRNVAGFRAHRKQAYELLISNAA